MRLLPTRGYQPRIFDDDFERHRLDVLERDLTAPPQVEILDEQHVKFNNLVYYKDKTNHYVVTNGLHRSIWQYHNGEIPAGCEIHHRDLNPLNNSIGNLECLTVSEHMSLHAPDRIKFRHKQIFTCQQCGKLYEGYPAGNNKYCSKECQKKGALKEHVCAYCGKTFFRKEIHAKYCSRECASLARRKSNLKTCPTCGKQFSTNKHKPRTFCSPECYHQRTDKPEPVERTEQRICVVCSRPFVASKYDKTKTCSPDCANEVRRVPKEIRDQIKAEYQKGVWGHGKQALARKYGVGQTVVTKIVNDAYPHYD